MLIVWAVISDEVDTLWTTLELAEKRRDHLNAAQNVVMWEVRMMHVFDEHDD